MAVPMQADVARVARWRGPVAAAGHLPPRLHSEDDRLVPRAASRAAFAGIAVLAMFAPLAFGAVETWARGAVMGLTLIVALIWAAGCMAQGRVRIRRTWLYLPAAAFLGWGALQILLARSVYLHATREELVWATGLALAWFLTMNAMNRAEARLLPHVFAWFGLAVAAFAIFQGLAGPHDTIYGWRSLSGGPTAYGPFVNKNHYAGYMALLAPLPAAMALFGAVRPEKRALYVFMSAVMLVSVVLSHSRAGAVVVVVELALLTLLVSRAWSRSGSQLHRGLLAGALAAVVIGGGALWLGGQPLVARISSLFGPPEKAGAAVRFQATWDTLRIFGDHPVWGTGLGTFGSVFPKYKSFDDGLFWAHAHNDWAQLAAETGVIGLLCALALLAGLIGVYRRARPESVRGFGGDSYTRAIAAGIFTGCTGLLLHSLVDFQMRIPATALTFAIFVGMGLALTPARAGGGQRN